MVQEQNNRAARTLARRQVLPPLNVVSGSVSYNTHGHLLITGPEDLIRLAAAQLTEMPSITLLVTEAISSTDEAQLRQALDAAPALPLFSLPLRQISGYLGRFSARVELHGQFAELAQLALRRDYFDLILDLSRQPLFQAELAPAGYFHISGAGHSLAEVIDLLPQYIGQFDKPRYFQVNSDLCAHSARGQTGCTRCLDVCPADAISSIKQLINIDPHLCHGAGGCATACPSGAISYALPQPRQLHDYIQRLIQAYRAAGGEAPVVLFHDRHSGRALLESRFEQLPGNLLPVELEELAAAGQETWLSCLALGARQVFLLATPALPDSMRVLLERETQLCRQILQGLGYAATRLQLGDIAPLLAPQTATTDSSCWPELATPPDPAGTKRERLFSALAALLAQSPAQPEVLALPAGAPFGQVVVDNSRCTLCMSCVAVCPTQALTAGGAKPALNFTEQACVQCNLCERACPERAIRLEPRLLLNERRREQQELHAEAAFDCVGCGKGFAPRSTVEKMLDKLGGHRLFQGPALQRLKMCEDCRVRDIYRDLNAHPEKQLEL